MTAIPQEAAAVPARAKHNNWKKWILFGVSSGVGFALMSAMMFAGYLWYSSRPKPWRTDALTAVWSKANVVSIGNIYTLDEKFGGYDLHFGLQNNTSSDITIPDTLTIMKHFSKNNTLADFSDVAKVDHSHFIPAHERAEFSMKLNWGCSVLDLASGLSQDRDPRVCYKEAFEDSDGLVLFDPNQRLQINLPKPALK